jgi:FKBP-type peptidyl-prolyl cis-trans isomerase SlyD
MKIGEKTFVSLSYELMVGGEVVDSAPKEQPLEFPFGAGFLLPAFEKNIEGLKAGDKFEFTLTPEDGYGPVVLEAIVELPIDIFKVDGKVEEGLLAVGNRVPMSTADGQHMLGVVVGVELDVVRMDFNHPMAGKTLDFSGEVVGVREATEADMAGMFGGGCSGSCGSEGDCEESCDCGCKNN